MHGPDRTVQLGLGQAREGDLRPGWVSEQDFDRVGGGGEAEEGRRELEGGDKGGVEGFERGGNKGVNRLKGKRRKDRILIHFDAISFLLLTTNNSRHRPY